MKYLIHGVQFIERIMVILAKVMIIAMVTITSVQVFCRYVLNFSIRWSEEVPLILMVWFGFISMAIGVKNKLHISIEFFYSLMPPKAQAVMERVVDLVTLLFGGCMVYYGFKLSVFTMTSTMPATKLPTGWLYAIIPIAGILIVYESIMSILKINTGMDVLKGGEQ